MGNTLLVFMDTEFTGLHKNTTLMSIGCAVSPDVKFYAEFTDYDKTQVTQWIKENVENNMMFTGCNMHYYRNNDGLKVQCCGTRDFIREKFITWLNEIKLYYRVDTIEFVSDVCHYDMVLVIDLLGSDDLHTAFSIPEFIVPACHDINQDIVDYMNKKEYEFYTGQDGFDINRETFLEKEFNYKTDDVDKKHNALYDAQIIREIYMRISNMEILEN